MQRLGAQSLLQQPLTPAQPLIHLDAGIGVVRRQHHQALGPRLVARLEKPADLVNDLVVIGHGANGPLFFARDGRSSRRQPFGSSDLESLPLDFPHNR